MTPGNDDERDPVIQGIWARFFETLNAMVDEGLDWHVVSRAAYVFGVGMCVAADGARAFAPLARDIADRAAIAAEREAAACAPHKRH